MSLDILAFFAHPDDETMLCGGTLALLAQQGARVHLLIATRGEGGEMGDPPVCVREELGKVREQELRCAAQALGAASLTIMDYCDPLVGPDNQLFPFSDDLDRLAAEVADAAQKCGASAVIAHGKNGEYGHPAHMLAHDAARLAVYSLGEDAPLFYSVQGAFANHPFPRLANKDTRAHMVIDVSPFRAQKTAAALCHATQNALFVRHGSEEAGRPLSVPEVIQTIESLHRVSPAVTGNEPIHDALADLIWVSGLAAQPPVEPA
jgi:N-acetylglucosamine malate deacetylase 2